MRYLLGLSNATLGWTALLHTCWNFSHLIAIPICKCYKIIRIEDLSQHNLGETFILYSMYVRTYLPFIYIFNKLLLDLFWQLHIYLLENIDFQSRNINRMGILVVGELAANIRDKRTIIWKSPKRRINEFSNSRHQYQSMKTGSIPG